MAAPYTQYPPPLGTSAVPPRPASLPPAAHGNGHGLNAPAEPDADAEGESDEVAMSESEASGKDEEDEDGDFEQGSEPEQSASPPVVPHGHANKKRNTKLSFPDELDADLYGLRRSVSPPSFPGTIPL